MRTSSASHRQYHTHFCRFSPSYCPVCLIPLSQLPLPYTAEGCIRSFTFLCLWCLRACVWVCVHRGRRMTSGSLWDVISSWSWSSRSFSWCGSPSIPVSMPTSQCCGHKSVPGHACPYYVGAGTQTLAVQQALWITELCLQRLLPACCWRRKNANV